MEDEIASSIAIQGAAWGGKKVMTVTSGPGLSLMMEHIGLAAITETPCVFVDVQRGGPSTGLPTLPAQADMMQVKWGSHGDYEIIALSPNSPQECFDLMIKAFNLAETYRVPVFFMMDEVVGHMTERVVIPEASEIEVVERKWTKKKPGEYRPYETDESLVPEMVKAGDGYRIHVTGLTHDERGYPAMNRAGAGQAGPAPGQQDPRATPTRSWTCARTGSRAPTSWWSPSASPRAWRPRRSRRRARAGVKVGHLRLVIAWPFPAQAHPRAGGDRQGVRRPRAEHGPDGPRGRARRGRQGPGAPLPHAGGTVHEPEVILAKIMEAAR